MQYSRNYSIITSLLRQKYVINCLYVFNNYFDKVVVTVKGSFVRNIFLDTYYRYLFQRLCKGLFQQRELNIHSKKLKRIKERLLICFRL